MKLHELSPVPGSNPKAYRKGRGNGSGNGKTAGRGQKGQWARSGGGVPLERCLTLGFPPKNIICMQGPFSRELNVALLRQYHIQTLGSASVVSFSGITTLVNFLQFSKAPLPILVTCFGITTDVTVSQS